MQALKSILARVQSKTLKNITEEPSPLPSVPEFCPPPEHCICGGSGFFRVDVPIEHRWFGKAHPCICSVVKQQQRYHEWLWQESRIPEGYRTVTLKDFNVTHEGNRLARDAAIKYILGELDTPWLAIFGTYGNGKTHLCTAMVRSFVLRGVYAIYGFVPDLLKEFRRGIEQSNYHNVVESWKKAMILALDDLGSEYETPWVRAEIEELLDYRYREHLPTIIATNLSIEELTDKSARIARRIRDKVVCTMVVNTAPMYEQ